MSAGPFVSGKERTEMTPLYHKRQFAAAAMGTEVLFFGEVRGVGGIGPQTTNMTRSFELEAPRKHQVNAVRIHFYDTDDADIQLIMWAYTVRLIVGGITRLDAGAEFWTGGMGMTGAGFTNGIQDPRAIYGLMPHPIGIPSGVGFSVGFYGNVGATPVAVARIGIFLDGPQTSPVG